MSNICIILNISCKAQLGIAENGAIKKVLFLLFDYKEGINATCQIAYLSTLLISPNPSLHP